MYKTKWTKRTKLHNFDQAPLPMDDVFLELREYNSDEDSYYNVMILYYSKLIL